VLLVVGFLLAPEASAEALATREAAIAVTEAVMQRVGQGDLRGAFELTKTHMAVPPAEIDAILGQAELQQPMLTARFGKTLGYEKLRTDDAGASLTQVLYLQRFEQHGMVWRFVLYRAADGWTINTFKSVDDITAAF
jgi:hypothetical protein